MTATVEADETVKAKISLPATGERTDQAPVDIDPEKLEDGEISEVSADEETVVKALRSSTTALPAADVTAKQGIKKSSQVKAQPLSAEELDHAKSIVLDLLGWGVPAEYLVDYGVSSQAIQKIFTDLQLRLPSNLYHTDRS